MMHEPDLGTGTMMSWGMGHGWLGGLLLVVLVLLIAALIKYLSGGE